MTLELPDLALPSTIALNTKHKGLNVH